MEKSVTVLITGAAGFIGRHVAAEYAKRGMRVIGMGRGDWSDWREYGISEWRCGEITLDTLVEWGGVPEVIVHCAGGASVGFSVENPAVDFDLTVRTTSHVLEYIRLYTPSTCLVYPSSAAVYGQVKTLPITEDAALSPMSAYGTHKLMAEILCQLYSQQFDLSIAIVRLFSIYGTGLRKQLLWDACRKFEQGGSEFFGTGEEIRDWLHIDDVAKLFITAAQNATSLCPIVNAGAGLGVSVKDILEQVSEQIGLGIKPTFSSQAKAGDPNAYIADISKTRDWNWEPKINWREGVIAYVDWYKQCQ
jgi:UDP-glucose 4-epimerase